MRSYEDQPMLARQITLVALLVLSVTTETVAQSTSPSVLKQRFPSCAVVNGASVSLCACSHVGNTGAIAPLNLTGIRLVDVDLCRVPIVGNNAGIGIDLTGSYNVHLHNGLVGSVQIGVLAGLDSNHCATREQGNNLIDNFNIDLTAIPGSIGVVSEGSEQISFQNNPWIFGARAGLLLVGDMGGGTPVPFLSPNIATCPTGQTQTVNTFYQTTFGSVAPHPAIEVRGDVSESFADGLYTVLEGGSGATYAVAFMGPWATSGTTGKVLYASNFNFGKGTFRNEGYSGDYQGPCVNCNFTSNIEMGPNGNGSSAVGGPTPAWSTPTSTMLPKSVATPAPSATPTATATSTATAAVMPLAPGNPTPKAR